MSDITNKFTNKFTNTITNTITNTEPSVPSIVGIMGGFRVPNWLQKEVEFHLGGSLLDKCIGIGLLVRLWAPEVGILLKELEGGGFTPREKADRWWAALPPEHRHTVIRDALLRIDNLMDDLPELRSRVAEDPVTAAPLALDWLRRRDDLQALLYMAHCTSDAPRVLEGALQTLDERAAAEHSIWFFLPPFDDERLRAVASEDPGAWWGDLAA